MTHFNEHSRLKFQKQPNYQLLLEQVQDFPVM